MGVMGMMAEFVVMAMLGVRVRAISIETLVVVAPVSTRDLLWNRNCTRNRNHNFHYNRNHTKFAAA
jgi:hypothetical protein